MFEEYQKKIDEMFDNGYRECSMISDFKLPIEYVEHSVVNDIIKVDLELNSPCVYREILKEYSMLTDKWSSYYTTDKSFLLDTQAHIKCFKTFYG